MTSQLPYCIVATSRDILAHSDDVSIPLDEQLKFFHLFCTDHTIVLCSKPYCLNILATYRNELQF